MDLSAACDWLERSYVGFSEIHRFAEACRATSSENTRESAALVLLAERAVAFNDRHEGIAVLNEVVTQFLREIREETIMLRDASRASDGELLQALNRVAAHLAENLVV